MQRWVERKLSTYRSYEFDLKGCHILVFEVGGANVGDDAKRETKLGQADWKKGPISHGPRQAGSTRTLALQEITPQYHLTLAQQANKESIPSAQVHIKPSELIRSQCDFGELSFLTLIFHNINYAIDGRYPMNP